MSDIYYNREYKKEFKKTDCPEDLGSLEVFVVPEAQFCSRVSQYDADDMAKQYAEIEGPVYANKVGTCCDVYYNSKQEGDFFSSHCPEGFKQRIPTHHEIEAGRFSSLDSVEDADYRARKLLNEEGQYLADVYGVCERIYWNEEQHGWYTKECAPGWKAPARYKHIEAGSVYSFVSVDDANAMAKEALDKEAQDWVNRNTECVLDTPSGFV